MAASESKVNDVLDNENTTQQPELAVTIDTFNLSCSDNTSNEDSSNEVIEDNLDIDFSTIEVEPAVLDSTFHSDGPKFVLSENIDEPYRDILSMCSSNAQSLRKSITDVLSARQSVVITEVDGNNGLEETLNQKIEDFAKAVSGCSSTVDNQCSESKKSSRESTPGTDESQSSVRENSKVSRKSDSKAASSQDAVNKKDKSPFAEVSSQSSKSVPVQQIQDAVKNITLAEEEKVSKKQKNAASKKKGEKTMDQILKSLGNGAAEEKLQHLCKKHIETLDELRNLEPQLRQLQRQVASQQREKEVLQSDNNRMILAKSTLEGLCREMQRQNKAIKEENLLRIKEEEEKRKEVTNKFQTTLNDISTLMTENSKKNIQLREENAELATKLKSLVDNYEVWEQNVTKVVQKKELETQLAKAKHAKVNLVLKQETEKFLKEKQSLLENLSELQKKCTMLATNELKVRTELSEYTAKYEEFQNVLTNSSKVFASFKSDMDSTTKKIKKLEKETNVYKQKWERSNTALLDMVAHKEKQDNDISTAQQRIFMLEKLCRALQAERNELQIQVNTLANGNAKEEPSIPVEVEAN